MDEFLLYETEDGRTRVECRFTADTLWLPQAGMAELFQTSKQNFKAIFAEGELDQNSVVNQWLTTAADGKNYRVTYYNLDAILAVGYRVRSPRGTQFRRWATERLREYLLKGFTLDDERLKNPPVAGSAGPVRRTAGTHPRHSRQRTSDVFTRSRDFHDGRRLLAHVAETTKFFRFIQNKLHFAVTGKTAAELIAERADDSRPHGAGHVEVEQRAESGCDRRQELPA